VSRSGNAAASRAVRVRPIILRGTLRAVAYFFLARFFLPADFQ